MKQYEFSLSISKNVFIVSFHLLKIASIARSQFTLADPGGRATPSWSNFFHFHAVFGKILANYRFLPQIQKLVAPVWEIRDPPPV